MPLAILDTNILLHYLKKGPLLRPIKDYLSGNNFIRLISVVSKAELMAIAKMRGWEKKKTENLNKILSCLSYVNIEYNNTELINAYAWIQAYSQGKSKGPNGQMLQTSSRNMGKNDLWIAATTYTLEAVLITTDKDFDHLHNVFFEVKKFQ